MTSDLTNVIYASVHAVVGAPASSLDLSPTTRLDDIGVDSRGFIKICVDLEQTAGIDLTLADELVRPQTIGDLVALAETLRRP